MGCEAVQEFRSQAQVFGHAQSTEQEINTNEYLSSLLKELSNEMVILSILLVETLLTTPSD